jgi:four helix bundle protein
MGIHNFKQLQIWHLAMDIVDDIYTVTKDYPKEEIFGLTSQTRKSVVSIPSNIAEGCGRGTNRQLAQFLNIAQGSAYELETQVYIALRRNYYDKNRLEQVIVKINKIQKMIYGFQRKFIKSP